MTIVGTGPQACAITGGVDTHADVHVAAALDPVGGLLGGQVEAIRALMVAKRTARSERIQTINQARSLIVTG